MEKFYIVTEESILHKDFYAYRANINVVNELYKAFTAENEIKATEYYVANDAFYIVPTDADKEKFGSALTNPLANGLQRFKGTSKIHKAWVKLLEEKETKVIRKPMVTLYMRMYGGGKFTNRLFDQNGILYCSIDPAPKETPTGFTEIKGSEFYKVLETDERESA